MYFVDTSSSYRISSIVIGKHHSPLYQQPIIPLNEGPLTVHFWPMWVSISFYTNTFWLRFLCSLKGNSCGCVSICITTITHVHTQTSSPESQARKSTRNLLINMDKASRWLNTTVNVTTGSLVNVCHRPETFILFGPRLSSFHLQHRHVLCNRTRTLWFVNEMAFAPKGIP